MAPRGANVRQGGLQADRKKMPMKKRLGGGGRAQKGNGATQVAKGDARLKIIQKNRVTIKDARDKLVQKAQTKDAREKLMKLREARVTGPTNMNNSFVRAVGNNITMKKDRHGKISLSTNKTQRGFGQAVSLGMAVQRQLGLVGALQSSSRQVQRKTALQQRQIGRGSAMLKRAPGAAYKLAATGVDPYKVAYLATPPVIRRTIHNDIVPELPPLPDFSSYSNQMESNLHWPNWGPSVRGGSAALELQKRKARHDFENFEMDEDVSMVSVGRLNSSRVPYVDLDAVEDTPPLRSISKPMRPGIRARLDTPSAAEQSHGIFANTRPKAPGSPGHRIVVSNLHNAVTQEDITELFADIGDLMVARLVRPGTAEVIYKNLPDAEKAVEVYHNRQLDGQPMKCLLVNKRPANNPTGPAVTKPTSMLRVGTAAGAIKKTPTVTPKNNKLVPDLSTIHKVLFNRT